MCINLYTQDQYAFIHDAVLETLICGDAQIPASDLQRALEKLSKIDKHNKTGFDKHLKVKTTYNIISL